MLNQDFLCLTYILYGGLNLNALIFVLLRKKFVFYHSSFIRGCENYLIMPVILKERKQEKVKNRR